MSGSGDTQYSQLSICHTFNTSCIRATIWDTLISPASAILLQPKPCWSTVGLKISFSHGKESAGTRAWPLDKHMLLSYSRSTSVQNFVLFITPMSLHVKSTLALVFVCWSEQGQTRHTTADGPSELTLIWLGSWLQVWEPDANNRFILVVCPALSRHTYKYIRCNNLASLALRKWLCKRLQFIWLTRRWRLNLRLFLGISSAEDFWRGLLPSLNLALEGKQVLNVLFFQGAGCTARSANVQGGCQLTPLLVFINLAK